jgi:oxygen-independent coproporphyrinogen-3 oxidase
MTELEDRLRDTPYESYLYAYPHKTAYRALSPRVPLAEAWAGERRDALFLYMHLPFCEMRCGFCNLFTTARPKGDFVDAYLDALERQCKVVAGALGDARFARFALGGGTPTLLEPPALARVLDLAEGVMGVDLARIPGSVETSPETATPERLKVLRDRGIDRVSIGVQSFLESEASAVNRPQHAADVQRALETMTALGFPTINIDLMYGLPEQTPDSWRLSLEAALSWRPAEIYLYPLYVRPLTTLGRRPKAEGDPRVALYRLARERLAEAGYTQASMRMFRASSAPSEDGPVYCIQEDGMVGLGCGARSYTSALHYASEYAVKARGVREILEEWVARDDDAFAHADWGFVLDPDEQRRRFVAMSLLVADGLDLDAYRCRFGTEAVDDLPALLELEPLGLATTTKASEASGASEACARRMALTPPGIERSDNLGPWLNSERVRERIRSWDAR